MKSDKKTLFLPIFLIAIGVGWLLTSLEIVPAVDWIWTLGLAVVGLLSLLIGGIDKVTVVVGPFFITASMLSFLRQTGRLYINTETPLLVIIIGVLLLITRSRAIPIPSWVIDEIKQKEE